MDWNLQFSARCEGYNERCLDNRFVLPSCDVYMSACVFNSKPPTTQTVAPKT